MFICVSACEYVHGSSDQRGIESFEAGIMDCELSEIDTRNWASVEEHEVLLTAEPSLYPRGHKLYFGHENGFQ